MSSLWSSLGFAARVEDEGDGLFSHDRLEPWVEELRDSIRHSRVEECEHLLRKLVDPNVRNGRGEGLLLTAVEVGSLEWTERLLLMGADPSMMMPRSRATYLDVAERNSKMYPFDTDRKMIVKLMNLANAARAGSPYAFPVVHQKTSVQPGRAEARGRDGGAVSGTDEKSIGGDEEDESEEGSERDGISGSVCDADLPSPFPIKDDGSPLLTALAGELRSFRTHVQKELGSINAKLNQLCVKVDVLSADAASLKGDTETLIDNASIRGTAITDLRTEVAHIKSLLESNEEEEEEDATSSSEDGASREEEAVDHTPRRNAVLGSPVFSVTSPDENNAFPTSGSECGAVNSAMGPGPCLVGHWSQGCGVVSGAEVAGVAVANSKQCSAVSKTTQAVTMVRKLNQEEEDNRGSKSVATVGVVDDEESNPSIDPKDLAACVDALFARSTIFGPTKVHHSLLSYYKRIVCQGPLTSGMLKYLLSQGKVTIHVDFSQSNLSKMVPNLKDLDGILTRGGKQKVHVNTTKRRVYVGAKPDGQSHSMDHVVGWLAIALTRLCIFLAFKNNCKPYENNDEEKRRKFEVIVAEAEKALRSPVCNFYVANAMKWKTADGKQVALISAVPGIISYYGQWSGVDILQKQVPSLLHFYRENVLPKFKCKGRS